MENTIRVTGTMKISTGTLLKWFQNEIGEYNLVIADKNDSVNCIAAEDLIGPDCYIDLKSGKVYNKR